MRSPRDSRNRDNRAFGNPADDGQARDGLARDTQAGVTLVEILVVLVLIGLLSGAVALGVGGGRGGGGLRQQADLLAVRLERAATEAMLTGRPTGFVWSDAGYRFLVWDGSAWEAHPVPVLAPRYDLGEPPTADTGERRAARQGNWTIAPDLAPEAPLRVTLRRGGTAFEVIFDGVSARVEAEG